MHILLIGATGQVGYAASVALAQAGHQVSVLVRDAARAPLPGQIRVIAAPVFTGDVFASALTDVDLVFYGVGLPEQFTVDENVFQRINRGLLNTFLSAMEATRLRRLVYVSAYEVFAPRDGVVRESHPLADLDGLSPYFAAMAEAYGEVLAFAERTSTRLTTIHPAALYGGLNTGFGFTDVIENLLNKRFWRLPVLLSGRFPLVHAASLGDAVCRVVGTAPDLGHDGAFIVSDGMFDLPTLVRELRAQTSSMAPPTVPAPLAYAAIAPIEAAGRLLRRRPLLARVQLDLVTAGIEPLAARARSQLGWTPMPLSTGIARYLQERGELLAARAALA